jgi:hypothetical protein
MRPLAGTVERVTFHDLENGFCALTVQVRRGTHLEARVHSPE